ncbi:MAG: class I SAM-dependent methyltransferase [Kiritimatiellae bacterium]|nr:class I SAM-dependent methyltransferase [Verrucomicrobiota bacterium]MBU4290054.1 class I SAM-dependent methyltransferase [Verrucomicrobiota bacterium]MCG2679181.1 class I SAM-dependent methyltransferase [Kiritimatiellia bacterium]
MKVRESGMPEAGLWHTFFDPEAILGAMGLTGNVRDAVDFGCGYGTFAIPAAKRIQGTLHGFDIDPAMIKASRRLAEQENAHNVRLHLRDFVTEGTGLDAASVDYVMLFNILHTEDPLRLLREASRILLPGGYVGAIHWNYDPETPRGPPMAMRPRPEDCRRWIEEAGFLIEKEHIHLPSYHYGVLARKKHV